MSQLKKTQINPKERFDLVVFDDGESYGGVEGAMVVLNGFNNDGDGIFDWDEESRLIPLARLIEGFLANERIVKGAETDHQFWAGQDLEH